MRQTREIQGVVTVRDNPQSPPTRLGVVMHVDANGYGELAARAGAMYATGVIARGVLVGVRTGWHLPLGEDALAAWVAAELGGDHETLAELENGAWTGRLLRAALAEHARG